MSELLDPNTKLLELVQSGILVIIIGKSEKQNSSALGLMKAVDIPANRIVFSKDLIRPIRCKKILLPQPTMVGSRCIDEKQTQATFYLTNRWYGINPSELRRKMKTITTGNGLSSEKLYLNRSKLQDNLRKIIGEDRLERELATRGWKIIYPETLSIQDQILELHHARVIGGNISSGFHTLLYLGDEARGKTVIGLGTDNFENERYTWMYNFVNQFRMQGIRFWHLSCLGFDDSTRELKLYNNLRYYDLKLLYRTRRIVRKMEAIANTALHTGPSEKT